jgi:hypothetical protein
VGVGIKAGEKIKFSDPLSRMIHRKRPRLAVDELRRFLASWMDIDNGKYLANLTRAVENMIPIAN